MDSGISQLFAPLLAGVVSLAAMLLLLRSPGLALDQPNERSLHSIAVPRTGGIAIMAGICAAALFLFAGRAIVGPAAGLAVLSLADDRHRLPALVRLSAHVLAAVAFVWASGLSEPLLLALVLVLALTWLTNLYNFMDGADGLAGGMTIIGFTCYAIAAWFGGISDLALLSLSVAAAAAGFLMFNFPPARMFLGDVGSIPLGFLAGAIGIAGWQQAAWPIWFPVLVFTPFIVDASATLLRRLWRGERIWQAHRQHYYQRLIISGWSHRKTAVCEYGLMLFCGIAALFCLGTSSMMRSLMIGLLFAVLAFAMCAVDYRWRNFSHRRA